MLETNADDVSDWIEEQVDELEEDVDDIVEQATEATLQRAQDEVPVDTGRLKNSLQRDDNSVFSDLDYAPHVGLGTIYQDGTDYLWGPAEEEITNALEQLANGD